MKELLPIKKISKCTTVYRYVRPLSFDHLRNELRYANGGGITFRFDIEHSLNIVRFSFVRCSNNICFNHELAKRQVDQRAKQNFSYLLIAVSKQMSLIDNVKRFIASSKEKQLIDLHKHLKLIDRENAKLSQSISNFYSAATEKVKAEYHLA